MSEQLRITFDAFDIDRLKDEFDIYRKDVKAVIQTAVKDTAAIVNEDMTDEMARICDLSARIVKGRIYLRYAYRNHSASVWVGLNPFSLKKLRPRQTGDGVTAHGRQYPGAFIVSSLGGHVFRRTGKGRWPIEKVIFDIKDQGEQAFENAAGKVEEIFRKVLQVKLNGARSRVQRKDIL
jgi:hypothetical protein